MSRLRRLVPSFIRRRYALKFGIVLLVIGLSVGAIGIVETSMITDTVEQTVLNEQQDQAVQEATEIENWNDRNDQLLLSTAQAPIFSAVQDEGQGGDGEDLAAIDGYLEDVYSELPENTRVNALYVDTSTDSGDILAGTGGAESLEELAFPETDELESASAYAVQRTDPYLIEDDVSLVFDERPVRSYYVGIPGTDRAVVLTFDLADRSSNSPTVWQSETVVTIVDDEGQIIADDAYLGYGSDPDNVSFGETYGNAELLDTAEENSLGALRFDEAPTDALQQEPYDFSPGGYVVGYYTTGEDWTVLVHTTEDQALGVVDSIGQFGALITLASVLIIAVLGAIIGRNTAASIDRLTEKARQMEAGDLDVELESNRIDNIGQLYDGFDSMRVELKNTIQEAEDARDEAEAERERVNRINTHLEQKADEYSTVMQAAADGDLTTRMDPESENEAMADIATEFNEMLGELETTVDQLSQFATDVATASEQVTASSEEVQTASAEVSTSVQEISDGADRQHQSLQSIDSELNTLSTTTEEIAASSSQVATLAERTATTSRDGSDTAQEAIDACEDLEDEHQAVVEEFEELETQVDQIAELTETITEIAAQTNMLALNASIEASRSASDGDTGGFSTVAEEVKELSQDVKEAAEQIDERLEAVESQTARSATEVDQTTDEIERVNDLVTTVVDDLEEIATYAQETNDGVQEISAATEQQAASTQEVVAMVDKVASISEETTAEAETVAAAAEEQTSALTEVTGSAQQLSQQATTLSAALDRFETDAAADTEDAALLDATVAGEGESAITSESAGMTDGSDDTDDTEDGEGSGDEETTANSDEDTDAEADVFEFTGDQAE
ncbi:methyl-accepting chemotaxis protein [Natrialba sp. SSL1]|uniref:methyl-accepting chemotaxis protein n=1 Tax=Natrialba sp. SSL1 TaxID=1869245 RepID=UPI0008F80752|nr:methyl-accepting chemotaxis protein [Natrialba sp. SSL1]OIB59330.1 chemotaxis protein [Natrialba sp. SSL1]